MAVQAAAIPITPFTLLNTPALSPPIRRIAEKSANTQLIGCPCFVDSTGFVLERTTISDGTSVIAGFTVEFAHNLTTSGVAQSLTYGSVQLQSGAKNIPMGAPLSDGLLGFYVANDNVLYKAKTDSTHALAQADIGTINSLTKDGTCNYWFVDTSNHTISSGACVEIVQLIDAIGTLGGLVAFRVMEVRQQFGGA